MWPFGTERGAASGARNRPLLFEERSPSELASPPRANGWRGVGLAVLVFMGTRLVVWTAAYSGAMLHVQISGRVEPPTWSHPEMLRAALGDPTSTVAGEWREYVAEFRPLLNWDAVHYCSVVREGYEYAPPPPGQVCGRGHNIQYFPLYPLLCTTLARAVGVPAALVLTANLAALATAILLYRYVRWRIDHEAALLAVAIVFCWPTACFYSFGYTESLNALFMVATMFLADRRIFVPAALACALATATRPTAITLVPVLVCVYWAGAGGPWLRRVAKGLGLGAVASLGVGVYAAYLIYRFGSPGVYYDNARFGSIPRITDSQWLGFLGGIHILKGFKYFVRAVSGFPTGLIHLSNPMAWSAPLTLAILILSILAWWRAPRRFRPWLLLGPLIFLLHYAGTGWSYLCIESLPRYMMLAIPVFVVLGAWAARKCKPWTQTVLLAGLLLLEANWAFRFGLGDWAG